MGIVLAVAKENFAKWLPFHLLVRTQQTHVGEIAGVLSLRSYVRRAGGQTSDRPSRPA